MDDRAISNSSFNGKRSFDNFRVETGQVEEQRGVHTLIPEMVEQASRERVPLDPGRGNPERSAAQPAQHSQPRLLLVPAGPSIAGQVAAVSPMLSLPTDILCYLAQSLDLASFGVCRSLSKFCNSFFNEPVHFHEQGEGSRNIDIFPDQSPEEHLRMVRHMGGSFSKLKMTLSEASPGLAATLAAASDWRELTIEVNDMSALAQFLRDLMAAPAPKDLAQTGMRKLSLNLCNVEVRTQGQESLAAPLEALAKFDPPWIGIDQLDLEDDADLSLLRHQLFPHLDYVGIGLGYSAEDAASVAKCFRNWENFPPRLYFTMPPGDLQALYEVLKTKPIRQLHLDHAQSEHAAVFVEMGIPHLSLSNLNYDREDVPWELGDALGTSKALKVLKIDMTCNLGSGTALVRGLKKNTSLTEFQCQDCFHEVEDKGGCLTAELISAALAHPALEEVEIWVVENAGLRAACESLERLKPHLQFTYVDISRDWDPEEGACMLQALCKEIEAEEQKLASSGNET